MNQSGEVAPGVAREDVRLAAVQMVSGAVLANNLAVAAHWIGEAVRQGAKLVLLPEYFVFLGGDDAARMRLAESYGAGPIQDFLRAQARQYGIWLFAGSLPLKTADPQLVSNSLLVFDDAGECVARYDKMHLFAYRNGSEQYDEQAVIVAGSSPVVVETPYARVALAICYDLRFPEFFRAMGEMNGGTPYDLIVLPAAFAASTGRAHWRTLLQARAIENQCYVLAAAQGGRHDGGRRTHGESLVIDPWGEVLDAKKQGEGVVLADLSHEKIRDVRTRLPALNGRRLSAWSAAH